MKNTRKLLAPVLLLIVCLFCTMTTVYSQQSAGQLYEKALFTEEVMGELQNAINLYQQILDNNPENKQIAAKALLHQGMCYEKLGNQEAIKKYQRLVDNYPGQKNEVALAKERLSKLLFVEEVSKTPLMPKFTKIKIPTNPQNGVLSPDGKKLAFVSDGAIWIIPLRGTVNSNIAGEPIRIAEIPDAWDYGSLMSWSTDGNWIAVNGEDTDEGTNVYIIKVANGELRTISIPKRGFSSFSYRLSLSPNGQILAFSAIELGMTTFDGEDHPHPHDRRIYTVPVQGGEPKQVSSKGARARLPAFSPDGKFVAYVGYSKGGNIGELWIVPTTGGNPMKLAKVNGQLRGPVWSSDGKYIATHHEPYNTHSSKEILVYALSSDLSTTGEPKKITLPKESYNILAGWTPDNELGVFIQSDEHSAIYTVPASGGKAVQVTQEVLWPYYPRWSPDGKNIYFRPTPTIVSSKEGDVVESESPVFYVSAIGGNIEEVPVVQPDLHLTSKVPGAGFNISPDGKKIVISTGHKRLRTPNKGNLWTISLKDGLLTRISAGKAFDGGYPCWSPDGKWIAFVSWFKVQPDIENFKAIYMIPSEGGKIRQITSKADSVGDGAITFSTNGENIAFFSGSTIKTIPVEGGQSKVLVTKIKSVDHSNLAYSPDGSKIAHNVKGKIWITSLDDGIPQELKTGLPKEARQRGFGWSPDSKKIAFFSTIGGNAEFWLVSDFLPLDKLAQKKEKEDKDITIHKVMDGSNGNPSPDGKYFAFIDWSNHPYNIVIKEIGTEKEMRLTNLNYEGDKGSPYDLIWSSDSKKIAYTWENDDEEFCDLRVIDINNSNPTVLKRVNWFENWIKPLDWSPDGEQILVQFFRKDIWQIGLMSVKDGSFILLKNTINGYNPPKAKFSPDGRHIAYDLSPNKENSNHDIYILNIDDKRETKLTTHPSHDYLMDWTPAGDKILFASDRSGTTDLWSISLDNGKSWGKPKLITNNVGAIIPMDCTQEGSLYYSTPGSSFDIYTVKINPETGKVNEQPVEIQLPYQGYNLHSAWSPDGKFLAYVSRIKEKSPRSLWIYSVETGLSKKLKYQKNAFFPSWFPDSKSILVNGYDKLNVFNVFTEEIIDTIQLKQHVGDEIRSTKISSDSKYIYYVRENRDLNLHAINRRDIETGKDKEMLRTPDDCLTIALSPDNKQLAIQSRHNETTRIIKLISTETGEERDILKFDANEYRYISLAWSPDGRYIYFSKPADPGWELFRIPASGGDAIDLGAKMHDFTGISMHPDGQQITFHSFVGLQKPGEIWVMENFLPEEEPRRK